MVIIGRSPGKLSQYSFTISLSQSSSVAGGVADEVKGTNGIAPLRLRRASLKQ
jgi:hypothetical protein